MNLQVLLDDSTAPDVELLGLCEHTGEVQPGFGFCALADEPQRLSEHCQLARARGAVALLVDAVAITHLPLTGTPCVAVENLAGRRGVLAARFYAEPSTALSCIGITGTNGKTSTAFHIADLLEKSGLAAGYMGTLGCGRLAQLQELGMTTANPVALQRLLAELRDAGARCVALEISSHALAQDRAAQVVIDCAVFTNLSRDHLDYHGSMSAYQAAKQKLFTEWPLSAAVINIDDPFGRHLVDVCPAPVVTYGQGGDWQWQSKTQARQTQVSWATPHGNFSHTFAGLPDYAVANLTAAMAAAVAIGQPFVQVTGQLEKLRGVPGRMEVVGTERGDAPLVFVDYAHTPDALQKVLSAAPRSADARLICVLGCGGDRDRGKRPLMGKIAQQLADEVWLTADNPRSEAPLHIIADMQGGMAANTGVPVHVCADRQQAIRAAITGAGATDVVVIAGKGHEPYQEIAGRRVDFDDRQVARSVLEGTH